LLDRELDSTFVELCGGRIVREVLLRHNVEKIFGYPGGAVLPVFDIVFGCPAFDFIIPRHEQGAGHMAQGYARVSGKPGVVLVTSGPGATNTITPMQDALADGIPLVVLCGQVPTAAFGTDAFQEADIVSLSQACTKWNYMVDDIEELPRRLKQAFEIATSGRPGPVLVGIPKDIGNSILRRALPRNHTTPEFRMPRTLDGPALLAVPIATPATTIANDEKLQAAAAMISAAERPVIYAGHGVLTSPDGPELLRRLAHEANIPVTTTMHGLGAFDELDDKHALHMLGMHGSAYANLAMQKADVIIALGARFDDRITGHVGGFAPAARSASAAGRGGIIHFEIEPKNINKTVAADIAVQGDVADSMRKLLSFLTEESDERAGWFAKIQQWKGDYPFVYHPTPTDGPASLKPQEVIESLDKWCEEYGKENVVVTTGVGQHQMWACQHYRWRHPRTLISSGGLGTMGYGLPAAIGAKRAAPEKVVVDIDGDASFVMSGLELMTASQYDVGVKVIVFNNRHQGMVIQWQGKPFRLFALSGNSPPDCSLTRPRQTFSTAPATRTVSCRTRTLSRSQTRWESMRSGVTTLPTCPPR
jgi:acetolactate synthase-1/2/3 large subunit